MRFRDEHDGAVAGMRTTWMHNPCSTALTYMRTNANSAWCTMCRLWWASATMLTLCMLLYVARLTVHKFAFQCALFVLNRFCHRDRAAGSRGRRGCPMHRCNGQPPGHCQKPAAFTVGILFRLRPQSPCKGESPEWTEGGTARDTAAGGRRPPSAHASQSLKDGLCRLQLQIQITRSHGTS